MAKRMVFALFGLFLFLSWAPLATAQTTAPKDEKKHTTIGKYATAAEAYEMWKANPDKVGDAQAVMKAVPEAKMPDVIKGRVAMAVNK